MSVQTPPPSLPCRCERGAASQSCHSALRGFIAGLPRRLRLSRNRKVPTIRTESFPPLTLDVRGESNDSCARLNEHRSPSPQPSPAGGRGRTGAAYDFRRAHLALSREGRGENVARVDASYETCSFPLPLRERARVRGKKFVSSPSAPAPDGSGGDARNDRSPHYANFTSVVASEARQTQY